MGSKGTYIVLDMSVDRVHNQAAKVRNLSGRPEAKLTPQEKVTNRMGPEVGTMSHSN